MKKFDQVNEHLHENGFLYVSDYTDGRGRVVAKLMHPTQGVIVMLERFSPPGNDEAIEVYTQVPGAGRTMESTLEALTALVDKGR